MKFKLPVKEELSRTEKHYCLAKWIIFSFMLLFFYTIMRVGIFSKWQPVFIIPLAISVSFFESELPSCVFALFCGFLTDIGCGYIFGFSAVWLMAVCVAASLLVRNLIRVNPINYMIVVLAAVLIEFSMDYLFNVFLWNVPKGEVILTSVIIPTSVATVVVSPAVYYLVRFVEKRLGSEDMDIVYYDENTDAEEKEDEQ